MSEEEVLERPWEELLRRAAAGDPERLSAFLESLPAMESARAMAHLSAEEQALVLQVLPVADAADLLEEMPDVQAADAVAMLSDGDAAAIFDELPSDESADIIGELDDDKAASVLGAMEEEDANDLRRLTLYEWDTAGGLMLTEHLTFEAHLTVAEVIEDLRSNADEYADYDVQYAYVTRDGRLAGVLRLRDLLVARSRTVIERLMIGNPISVRVAASLEELEGLFDRHAFLALPVVDEQEALIGVVRRAAVEEAVGERAEEIHLKSHGIVGGEELRSMPIWLRARRRLAWLSVNVVLNILAASVIAFHQDTLTAVIALAVFLPIISDMSGCSGNQAVAVSLRELTLGLVRPNELLHVWLKEVSVGVINGLVLGGLLGTVAYLWRGNPWLGLVVGSALAINTAVAVSIGGAVPLILRRLNMDPALASGPVLTTITDMCGFLLVLGSASLLLPKLV